MRRSALLCTGLAAAALMFSACGESRSGEIQTSQLAADQDTTYEYVVPFGTGNRLDSGEVIELMPPDLNVKVGESIRIVNDDTRDYMIGPFFVTAGQVLAMQFTHPGVLTGICLVSGSGEFTITVSK